jgi:hypothetical protein
LSDESDGAEDEEGVVARAGSQDVSKGLPGVIKCPETLPIVG